MAGFLDFCGDFFAANCANDANGRPIRVIRAIRGSDFGCGLPRCEHSGCQEDLVWSHGLRGSCDSARVAIRAIRG
ncbi:MAG: hypothetical protein DMG12_00965 [Acidobacteria bacterium]|nr:MAG: hypothetical protein DMG12_00965 [Acidobacteriota bacterium]